MCFPTAVAPAPAPKPPEAPEAVAKAPVSGTKIKLDEQKEAGLKGPSLFVPRSTINLPS
jgi:hypothetical protein